MKQKSLVVAPLNPPDMGLSNRLRVCLSAIKICEQNNWRLRIGWDYFHELFPEASKNIECLVDKDTIIRVNSLDDIEHTLVCHPYHFYPLGHRDGDERGGLVPFLNQPLPDWYLEADTDSQFFVDQELEPEHINPAFDYGYWFKRLGTLNDEIMSTIRRHMFYFQDSKFGVHRRAGDHDGRLFDDQDYFNMIDQNPRQPFFVCTDSQEFLDKCRHRYGNLVYYNATEPSKLPDRFSKESHFYAMIDLVLLSEQATIIGTARSSFSHTAASIRNSNLVLVGE